MKPFFATFLAFLILAQSFNRTVLVANFELNQRAITKEFCVNKSNPLLQCHGKCHLAKELKKADQADDKLPTSVKEKLEVTQFWIDFPAFVFFKPVRKSSEFLPYLVTAYSPPDFRIFQPPKLMI